MIFVAYRDRAVPGFVDYWPLLVVGMALVVVAVLLCPARADYSEGDE